MKLLNHFKTMQDMASRYMEPTDYVDREGKTYQDDDPAPRNEAFINDMLYMLDGPEQREAQAEGVVLRDRLGDHELDHYAKLHSDFGQAQNS